MQVTFLALFRFKLFRQEEMYTYAAYLWGPCSYLHCNNVGHKIARRLEVQNNERYNFMYCTVLSCTVDIFRSPYLEPRLKLLKRYACYNSWSLKWTNKLPIISRNAEMPDDGVIYIKCRKNLNALWVCRLITKTVDNLKVYFSRRHTILPNLTAIKQLHATGGSLSFILSIVDLKW